MRAVLIDNHDSFVYNIVGVLERIRSEESFGELTWNVVRNDTVPVEAIERADAVILSPGPGVPSEAGALMEIIGRYVGEKPMFGICLGFQAIAEHFGGKLINLAETRHGHLSHLCGIDASDPVMGGLKGTTPCVGRYHSWGVDRGTLPLCLIPTSVDEEGNLMSFRHRSLPVYGTQFHPESYISDCGEGILRSFFKQTRAWQNSLE